MRFDAIGPSSDVTKRQGPQYGATTREGIIVRWQATTGRKSEKYKGGGNLNVLIADYTTLRNRAMAVVDAQHPSLNTANGGPGTSLAATSHDHGHGEGAPALQLDAGRLLEPANA